MNLSYFISKRISREQKKGFASTIHKIAIASIGVGLASVLVAFLIMKGFQETVKNKVYSFSSHLTVTKFSMSNSTEEQPMNYHLNVYDNKEDYPYVKHIQEYVHKVGLIKTEDEVFGVVVKGVGKSFDAETFKENIIEGEFIRFQDSSYANEVVISKYIADKIKAKVGDNLIVHFFQNPPRARKLKITGLYETNLSEYFDSKFIITDIRLIRRLNDWPDSLAGGLEIFLHNSNAIEEAATILGETMDFDLNIAPINQKYAQVFEWLDLITRQVNILLGVILVVVCVNMISIVLILVMERTQMIGLLKALGARNGLIRSIFIHQGINLIIKGLAFGNILGLGLCFIQYRFRIVKLNAHDYFMSFVPIGWDWQVVGALNLLTLAVVTLVLLVPTMIISKISPMKAIRFD